MLDNIPKNKGKGVPDPYFEGRFDEVFEMPCIIMFYIYILCISKKSP
jgi:hypothetical protein